MRNISVQMRAHVAGQVTTLATCIAVIPTQSSYKPPIYMTEHNRDLLIDGNVYTPRVAFTLSTIQTSTDYSSDNTELTLGGKDFGDILDYKLADVIIFYVNWNDLSMGRISLFRGYVSSAELTEKKELKLTVSGLGKKLSKTYLPKYSRTCRTELGSAKCGVPTFPVGTPDYFFSFPRYYKAGEQPVERPTFTSVTEFDVNNAVLPTGCTVVGSTLVFDGSNVPSTASISFVPTTPAGQLLTLEADIGATNVTYLIEQLDALGESLQLVWYKFDVIGTHNISTYVLPSAATIKISFTATQATVVTPNVYTTVDTLTPVRKKLARITNYAGQDRVIVPNGYFYKDGDFTTSFNLTRLEDWTMTTTNGYSVNNGHITGVDTIISQRIALPPLGCTLLVDGCYFLHVVTPHTGDVSVEVNLYDETGALVDTFTYTGDSGKIQMDTAPEEMEIVINMISGTVNKVEAYIYNALVSAVNDPTSVLLSNSGELGTLNDIWLDETSQLLYSGTVTAIPYPAESRILTVSGLSDVGYGYIMFLTGPNAGVKRRVRAYKHDTTQLELYDKLPNMFTVGDTFIAVIGCNKTILTCGGTFNNAINFRGEPYMPTLEKVNEIING